METRHIFSSNWLSEHFQSIVIRFSIKKISIIRDGAEVEIFSWET